MQRRPTSATYLTLRFKLIAINYAKPSRMNAAPPKRHHRPWLSAKAVGRPDLFMQFVRG
jgi:hypothetical protein